MPDSSEDKPLQTASFVVHATRGLLRDQKTRRSAMVVVLISALLLMIAGGTLLQDALNPHEHPGWFIFYWLLCAWLTLTAILLALFDLLMLRSDARKAERELKTEMENRPPRSPAEP